MAGYTPLFDSLVLSTIWREDDKTRILWITMLAIKNHKGEIEASIPGLADIARLSVEDCEASLAKLMAPDKYSRSKEFEGRRVVSIPGGFRVLNHEKYRTKALSRATYMKEYREIQKYQYDGIPGTTTKRFEKPTPEEVAAYAKTIEFNLNGQQFCDFYESKGWKVGNSPMKSWEAAVRTWKQKRADSPAGRDSVDDTVRKAMAL